MKKLILVLLTVASIGCYATEGISERKNSKYLTTTVIFPLAIPLHGVGYTRQIGGGYELDFRAELLLTENISAIDTKSQIYKRFHDNFSYGLGFGQMSFTNVYDSKVRSRCYTQSAIRFETDFFIHEMAIQLRNKSKNAEPHLAYTFGIKF